MKNHESTQSSPPAQSGSQTQSPSPANDFIDTEELCRRLGCSRRTTANLRERGKLPAVILGRLVRYHWPTRRGHAFAPSNGTANDK